MAGDMIRVARDLLPPLVFRGLKRVVVGHQTKETERRLPEFGRSIRHRPTPADRGVIQQIFVARDYDLTSLKRNREVMQFYRDCEQALIVDVGANIGASAVWFGCQFPRAKIIALEPEADNFRLLATNVKNLDVREIRGAIANKSGTLDLFDPGEGEWGYRTHGEGPAISTVRAFTLRELVSMEGNAKPFILKMDVEGAEQGLFDDDPETYDHFPIVIVEIHDWMLPRQGTSKSFLRWHSAADRDLVIRGENLLSLSNKLLPKTP